MSTLTAMLGPWACRRPWCWAAPALWPTRIGTSLRSILPLAVPATPGGAEHHPFTGRDPDPADRDPAARPGDAE